MSLSPLERKALGNQINLLHKFLNLICSQILPHEIQRVVVRELFLSLKKFDLLCYLAFRLSSVHSAP